MLKTGSEFKINARHGHVQYVATKFLQLNEEGREVLWVKSDNYIIVMFRWPTENPLEDKKTGGGGGNGGYQNV